MHPRRILLLLATLGMGFSLARSDAAQAQSIPSPYRFIDTRMEAGLFAGGNFFVGEGAYGIGPQPGPIVGGRFGVTLAGPFSIDAVVTYTDSKRDVKDPRPEGDLVIIGESPADLLTLDARIKFNFIGTRTWHRIAPFLLAGAGITFDLAGQSEWDRLLLPEDRYEFGTSFSGILGAGARWFLNERISLRSDLALQLFQQDVPQGYPLYPALVRAPNSEWIQAWGLTVGAAYNF